MFYYLLKINNSRLTTDFLFFFCYFVGNRSRPTTQSGNSAIKESGDSNSATIDDANDIERLDRLSKNK
jgi:hypothetical protein